MPELLESITHLYGPTASSYLLNTNGASTAQQKPMAFLQHNLIKQTLPTQIVTTAGPSVYYLYGSSRLGEQKHYAGTSTGQIYHHQEGGLSYEFADHLGNVKLTTNNRLKLHYRNNSLHLEPTLLSSVDYYPFGMVMPGLNRNSGEYRYGFNGMEKDDEVKGSGNSLDFNFRIYDPRLGKFLSTDPLTSSYPSQSPYHFAGNTPIQAIDLEGLEMFLVNGYDGYSNTTKDAAKSADLAKMMKYWTNNNPEFVKQATDAFKEKDVRYLDGSQGGFSHGDVSERFQAGKDNALKLVNADQVDFSKPITIIGHSQGGAHASGLASGLLEANPDAVINVLLLAPDGAEDFGIDPRVNSVQFTFPDDGIVTDNKATVKNVDQNISPSQEFSPFQSKSISKAMKAHSAPIDSKVTAGSIMNNKKTQDTFKTGNER